MAKFIVTFKTPNAIDKSLVDTIWEAQDLDKEARTELWFKVKETADKFVEYDEYISIEFDTEKGTATVIPR